MAVRHSLPPLNALRVFASVGRLGSFTAAATELRVSQPAVSRHVAVLEAFLGVKLFQRGPSGVALTAAGQILLGETSPALDRIAEAAASIRDADRHGPLRLRVYATFAVKWLLPRLPRFHLLHPDIELTLSATATPVNFATDDADLAIQFGPGTWPGLHAQFLLPDLIQPVCSPLLPGPLPTAGPEIFLAGHRMLHSHYRRRDWPDWLAQAGLTPLLRPGQVFPSSVLTLQAAAEGLGVAIGQTALLAEDFKIGRLLPLFGPPHRRSLGHFLVWPSGRSLDRKGRAFANWLAAETDDPHPHLLDRSGLP